MIIIVIVGAELKVHLGNHVSKPRYGMGCVRPAGVRQDNRETKKISWSIKESDFSRLMSFPSSSRRERISSSGPLGKGMEMGDGRDADGV